MAKQNFNSLRAEMGKLKVYQINPWELYKKSFDECIAYTEEAITQHANVQDQYSNYIEIHLKTNDCLLQPALSLSCLLAFFSNLQDSIRTAGKVYYKRILLELCKVYTILRSATYETEIQLDYEFWLVLQGTPKQNIDLIQGMFQEKLKSELFTHDPCVLRYKEIEAEIERINNRKPDDDDLVEEFALIDIYNVYDDTSDITNNVKYKEEFGLEQIGFEVGVNRAKKTIADNVATVNKAVADLGDKLTPDDKKTIQNNLNDISKEWVKQLTDKGYATKDIQTAINNEFKAIADTLKQAQSKKPAAEKVEQKKASKPEKTKK